MATTPTQKPIPSNDVIDFSFNVEKVDEVVNSDAEKYIDRFGVARYTLAGIRKNLSPLGKTYTHDQALEAIASGEIPNGAFFFIWSNDGVYLAKLYKNIDGVPIYQDDGFIKSSITFTEADRLTRARSSLSAIADAALNVSLAENVFESQGFTSDGLFGVYINSAHGTSHEQFSIISNLTVLSNGYPIYKLKVLAGDDFSDGVRKTFYRAVSVRALTHTATIEGPTVYRVIYVAPFESESIGGSHYQAIDESDVLSPTTYYSSELVTVPSSSLHGETGNVVISVPKTTLAESGLPDSAAGALSWVNANALDSVLRIRVDSLQTELFDSLIVADPGTLDIVISTTGRNLQSDYAMVPTFNLNVRTSHKARNYSDSGHVRFGADVKNNLDEDYTNRHVEIKVNFPQGEVPGDGAIIIEDDSGNVFYGQFAEEWDVNARRQSSMGYWPDGSLRSGSVFFIDSIPAKSTKYYTIKAYQSQRQAYALPVIAKDQTGYQITSGDIEYSFPQSNGFQLSSVKNGDATKNVTYSMYQVTKEANDTLHDIAFVPSRCRFSVCNNGPVFTEVETIAFNRPDNSSPDGVLKSRIRTRMYKNGIVSIRTATSATTDIPADAVFGVMSRTNIDVVSPSIDAELSSAIWSNPETSKYESVSTLYANGDVHRDGTNYGPNRPVDVRLLQLSNTMIRVYAGWGYQNVTTCPAIPAGWTWTHEIIINNNETAESLTSVAAFNHNRPIGVSGVAVHPYVTQQRAADKIAELCMGYTRYWLNDTTSSEVGSPYRNGYAAELVNFVKYGVGDFDAIYNDFIEYCDTNHGGIDSLGAKYTAGSLLLQFASRTIAQPLWWLYKLAVQRGDTAKITTLKTGILNLATALKNMFVSRGGIPLQSTHDGIGNSNSNAAGYRFISFAIASGQDSDGQFVEALDGLDTLFTTRLMPVKNILSDGPDEDLPPTHYLHYTAYAYSNYMQGVKVANRENKVNMGSYFLNGMASYGAPKDVDYCISESRRGVVDTLVWMAHIGIAESGLSGVSAAMLILEQIEREYGPRPGYPRRFYDFSDVTSDMDTLQVGFMLNILADIWFDYYFSVR